MRVARGEGEREPAERTAREGNGAARALPRAVNSVRVGALAKEQQRNAPVARRRRGAAAAATAAARVQRGVSGVVASVDVGTAREERRRGITFVCRGRARARTHREMERRQPSRPFRLQVLRSGDVRRRRVGISACVQESLGHRGVPKRRRFVESCEAKDVDRCSFGASL